MSEPTQDLKDKAATLAEALPYLRRYWGAVMVIKCGGAVLLDPAIQSSVLEDVTLLRYAGMKPVLVHGGGPEISEMMRRLGKEPKIVEGLRVTDAETMDIVQMVLVGRINQQLVAAVNQQGGRAVGLSGRDDRLVIAVKHAGPVDLGQVGEIEEIRPQLLLTLLQEGYVPVVAPIAAGRSGETFNVNADHAAGHLAGALGAAKLIILSDVAGVLRDRRDESSLISTMTVNEAQKVLDSGAVEEGMKPKIEGCLSALRSGVERCHIIDGRIPHALLMEVLTDVGIGTMITG
jgi:acetylglutamate kinase